MIRKILVSTSLLLAFLFVACYAVYYPDGDEWAWSLRHRVKVERGNRCVLFRLHWEIPDAEYTGRSTVRWKRLNKYGYRFERREGILFEIRKGKGFRPDGYHRDTLVQVPSYALMVLFLSLLVYPSLAFIKGPYRRYRRREMGLCVTCGYNLTGLLEPRCPECATACEPSGGDLEDEGRADMIRVLTAANPAEAHLIRGFLEARGIRAVVQGESLWAMRGKLPVTTDTLPSVWVANEDAERAGTLIAERRGSAAPTHCGACGYDLTGLPEPRCPECGMSFHRPESWVCPDCDEVIEAQFAVCWKCAGATDTAPDHDRR